MNRLIDVCGGILILLIATVMYFAGASVQAMALLLVILALAIFIRESSRWAILYLGLVVNLLFLWLALWFMDGQVSYLFDDSFTPYYRKVLLLEALFWVTFSVLFSLGRHASQRTEIIWTNKQTRQLVNIQYLIAIVVLLLEVALSSSAYFKPYSEVSDTGTVAYELGCLLMGMAVVTRSNSAYGKGVLMLIVLGTGLALFIALGSGKRLPLAYLLIAYMLLFLRHYGKLRTMLLFFGISGLGFVFGVLRDYMTIDGIDGALLMAGLNSINQGAVLHASAVYLRIADEGLSSVLDRGISFLSNFIGALILPISILPEQAQVNLHAMRYYAVQGNGGFVGSYSYFFLGWAGPVLFASAMAWLLSRSGRWATVIGMIILLTSPRWILYNIGPVVRLIGMTLIILVCTDFCYKLFFISKRKNRVTHIPRKREGMQFNL